MKRTRIGGPRGAELSRKDFLRLGGSGLAGAALLGASGCGGVGGSSSGEVVFSWGPDDTGVLPKLIQKFNEEHNGEFQVRYREMPSDTGGRS